MPNDLHNTDSTIHSGYYAKRPTPNDLHNTDSTIHSGYYAKRPMQNDLHNTDSTIHSGYYAKQITRKFKPAWSPPFSIYSNAESSNTEDMPYSQEVFGNTVNKKCVVSETGTFLRTS